MILIVCLDDNNGMMFNNRRQSQDSVVSKKILEETSDRPLWMNEYSYKQFLDFDYKNIIVDDRFLEKVNQGEYCFVENSNITAFEEKIEKIIIFKWNRVYPSDFKFGIPIKEHGWNLIAKEQFIGKSHQKITREVYGK